MTTKTFLKRVALLLGAACLLASAAYSAPAPSGAKLTFRRVFKGSSPEFIEINVREDSDVAAYEIRQLDEDAGASPFQVGAALRAKMFDLAAQLKHFQGQDLDVHRRIANLGEKTFRWESGAEVHETKFNYTLNPAAAQLLQIFEGLARQQEHADLITRRMRYDRLGINDALLQFESDLNRSLLPEPQRLLPMLEQIAGDSKFVDIARQRARSLAERIRHQS
jgi:hypothetical protein